MEDKADLYEAAPKILDNGTISSDHKIFCEKICLHITFREQN